MLLHIQEEGMATVLVLHFQETLCALCVSLANSWKKWPTPPEPHCPGWNTSPETSMYSRPADAFWPGSWRLPPPQWNNSDESWSSWLISNKKLSSKNGVSGPDVCGQLSGWFQRLQPEKRLEGGQRLEQGVSLGLFCPSTVEARESRGTTDCTAHKPLLKYSVNHSTFSIHCTNLF